MLGCCLNLAELTINRAQARLEIGFDQLASLAFRLYDYFICYAFMAFAYYWALIRCHFKRRLLFLFAANFRFAVPGGNSSLHHLARSSNFDLISFSMDFCLNYFSEIQSLTGPHLQSPSPVLSHLALCSCCWYSHQRCCAP